MGRSVRRSNRPKKLESSGGAVNTEPPQEVEEIKYSEVFEKLCPYYMSIGMTYDQFWHGDPRMTRYYREAHEYYREQKNQEMFIQSMYIYEAFKAVIDNFSYGLGGGKGKRPEGFRKYPYALTEREKEAEHQRKIQHTLEWVAQGQE